MKRAEIRALMDRYRLRANKSLGQNFLVDPVHLERIVAAAEIGEGETVLEIGPGLGALTERLLATGSRVIAVELDRGFIPVLEDRFGQVPDFYLEHGDILDSDIPSLLEREGLSGDAGSGATAYKVVANIPYYITSAVLRHLLESEVPPECLVLLVQKEVAERITAKPGDLSLLAVGVQFYGEPEIVGIVPAGAFFPSPKVDSAILRVRPYPERRYVVEDPDLFWEIVKAGFGQKRKQLKNSLNAGLPRFTSEAVQSALERAGIDVKRRAQSLRIGEWVSLYEAFVTLRES